MATDSMVAGLFQDPQQYQQAMLQQQMKQNYDIAGLSPEQQVTGGLRNAGYQLGGAVGGLMGAQDPQMKLMAMRKQVLQGLDPTDVAGITKAAQALAQAGDQEGAMQLAQKALQVRDTESQISGRTEEKQAQRAMLMQQAADRNATQLEAVRLRNEATIEAAKERGASQREIAKMQIEGRNQLAQIAAALKQGFQADKPLTTADLKLVSAAQTQYQGAVDVQDEAAKYIKLIDEGKMKFGFTENLGSTYRTATSGANESDLNKTNFEQFVQSSVNNVLNQAKGTQAKDDAIRAEKQILSALSKNDNKAVKASLGELQRVMDTVAKEAEGTLSLIGGERKRDLVPKRTAATPNAFTSVEAATRANLPKGTIITINGRRAVVE